MDVKAVREALRTHLTDRTIRLTEDDVQYIKAIEADYYAPSYLYGKSVHADEIIQGHIAGCGTLAFHFTLSGSCIDHVEVKGDYFALGDVQVAFGEAWNGKDFTRSTLVEAVASAHPEHSIRGLREEYLVELLNHSFES